MKNFVTYILAVFIIAGLSSCEDDYLFYADLEDSAATSEVIESYTLSELVDAINVSQYDCSDTLDCEGDYAYVTGYVYISNVFPDESRMLFYTEQNLSFSGILDQSIIEVEVNEEDSATFFDAIDSISSESVDSKWIEVKIKAQIFGVDLLMNGTSSKSFKLKAYTVE